LAVLVIGCVIVIEHFSVESQTAAIPSQRGSSAAYETFAVPLKIRAPGFAGQTTAKPESGYGCSLSSGKRVRVRAGYKTNFASFPIVL
jgi:hypothetical protein